MATKSAKDYLEAYGYVLGDDGKYRRPGKRTQVWQEIDGGWLRFDDPGEEPMPHRVSDSYQGTAGLDKTAHPEAFDWVWPDGEVELIYKAAVAEAS